MTKRSQLLCLDVGTTRIGVAMGDSVIRIAVPYGYVNVDGNEITEIARLVIDNSIDTIVVGYPRNQSGQPTAQTDYVESFVGLLGDFDATIVYQDESLTSVMAEDRLSSRRKAFEKGDIDAEAAAIILQDYMEQNL